MKKMIKEVFTWLFVIAIFLCVMTYMFIPIVQSDSVYHETFDGIELKVETKQEFTRGSAVAHGYDDNGNLTSCAVIFGTMDVRRVPHVEVVRKAKQACLNGA